MNNKGKDSVLMLTVFQPVTERDSHGIERQALPLMKLDTGIFVLI